MTLLRGMWRCGSMAPKKDFGSALLRPMPNSRRAAPKLRSHPGSEVRHQQGEADDGEQRRPGSGRPRNEGGGLVRQRLGCGPHELRGVDLEGGENADHDAGEHGGEQNVAPRILRLL